MLSIRASLRPLGVVFLAATLALIVAPAPAPAQDAELPETQPFDDTFDDLFGETPQGDTTAPPGEAEMPFEPRNSLEQMHMSMLTQLQQANPEVVREIVRLYTEAIQLMEQQRYREAIQRLESLNQNAQAKYVPALYEQGRAHAALKEWFLAERRLREASEYQATYTQGRSISPLILVAQSEVALATRNYSDAKDYLQQAEAVEPTNPEIAYRLGAAAYRLGLTYAGRENAQLLEYQLAEDVLDRAIQLRQGYGEALFERGRVRWQLARLGDSKKRDAAVRDLEQAVALLPEHRQAWAHLGLVYSDRASYEGEFHRGETQKVIADLHKSLQAYDRFTELCRAAGLPLPEDAEEEERAVDEMTYEAGLVNRAEVRIALADEVRDPQRSTQLYRQAIEDARLSLETERESARAYYQIGIAYRMLNDHRRAIEAYTDCLAVSQFPSSEVLVRRGISHYRLGDLGSAAADFMFAGRYQADARASFWLGIVRLEEGDYPEAARLFTEALRRAGYNYPLAHLNRGITFMYLGNYERAIDDFDRVLAADPSDSRASQLRRQAMRLAGRS